MTTRFGRVGLLVFGTIAVCAGEAPAQTSGWRIERLTLRPRAEWQSRYQDARFGPEQTETFSRTLRAGRGVTLDLQNITGSITVTGAAGDDIVIEAVKRARARDAQRAKAILAALDIRLEERPLRVTIRTVYPRIGSGSAAVDYTVRVPQDAAVVLNSVSGDLRVANVRGELRLETVSGGVHAGQSPRLGFAKSMSGNVEITGTIEGELSASSLTGALLLKDVKARAVELTTISGDVVLNGVSVDRARVRSVNGDLHFTGALSKNGRYDMNSHSGRIQLMLPATSGFEIDASTYSGNLRSDLPLMITGNRSTPIPPAPPVPPKRTRGSDDDRRGARVVIQERGRAGRSQTIRGIFGDASAYITIHTFSGDIILGKVEK